MDELVRLASFLGRKRILRTLADPLAKACSFLSLVREERTKTCWEDKWDSFADLGEKAFATGHTSRKHAIVLRAKQSECCARRTRRFSKEEGRWQGRVRLERRLPSCAS